MLITAVFINLALFTGFGELENVWESIVYIQIQI
jgi:hypothetical protein